MSRWLAAPFAFIAGCECYPTNTLTPDAVTGSRRLSRQSAARPAMRSIVVRPRASSVP
jgi:hypothetical protein